MDDKKSLISPCSCTGSAKFVHEECMISWISKIMHDSKKSVEEGKAFIYC